MNSKEFPDDEDAFEQFYRNFEPQHFLYTEANHRVGKATLAMFVSWFPSFLSPVVRSALYAFWDDSLIQAFHFPEPSLVMRLLVDGSLRLCARIQSWLPQRHCPRLRTMMVHPFYPSSYDIERVGPPGTV